MLYGYLIIGLIHLFVLLLGLSVSRSILQLKLRREENRKRELETMLLEKKMEVLQHGSQITENLEELLYRARINEEIDRLIGKSGKG